MRRAERDQPEHERTSSGGTKGSRLRPPSSGIALVDAHEHNGITARENAAVRELSGGRVDLHRLGASVERVGPSDTRLREVGAHSLTQGTRALVGRERDRGHEIWHLAQQVSGRVRADSSVAGQPVSRDVGLEREADRMGRQIAAFPSSRSSSARSSSARTPSPSAPPNPAPASAPSPQAPIQGVFGEDEEEPKPDPFAHRKAQFKKGIDPDEARARRREQAEELRKERRAKDIAERRSRASQNLAPPQSSSALPFSFMPSSSGFSFAPLSSDGFSFAPPSLPLSLSPPPSSFTPLTPLSPPPSSFTPLSPPPSSFTPLTPLSPPPSSFTPLSPFAPLSSYKPPSAPLSFSPPLSLAPPSSFSPPSSFTPPSSFSPPSSFTPPSSFSPPSSLTPPSSFRTPLTPTLPLSLASPSSFPSLSAFPPPLPFGPPRTLPFWLPSSLPTLVSPPPSSSELEADIDELTQQLAALSLSFSDLSGETHRVYVDPEAEDVIVHSNPTPLATIIAAGKWEKIAISASDLVDLGTAQTTIAAELKNFGGNRSQKAGKALRKALEDAKKILEGISNIPLPATDLSSSDNHNNNGGVTEGSHVIAEPLSLNSATPGFGPSKDGRLMTAIRAAAPGKEGSSYIQMHLLNDNVFGPGQLWNLAAGTSQSNHDMEADIETDLKAAVIDEGLVMRFEATVDYKNDPMAATKSDLDNDPDKYRFNKIDFAATQWFADSKAKKYKAGANKSARIKSIDGGKVLWKWGSLTPLKAKPKILSTTDQQELEDVGIDATSAKKIVAFNTAATGFALAGRASKQTQLQDAIFDWESLTYTGKGSPRRIKIDWNANAVLWQ